MKFFITTTIVLCTFFTTRSLGQTTIAMDSSAIQPSPSMMSSDSMNMSATPSLNMTSSSGRKQK